MKVKLFIQEGDLLVWMEIVKNNMKLQLLHSAGIVYHTLSALYKGITSILVYKRVTQVVLHISVHNLWVKSWLFC